MNRLAKLMCALAAMAVGMGAFSADVDLTQWRMAMATNGYVAVEHKVKVPQDVQKEIWKCYRKHIGLEGVRMSRPRLVSTNEFGAVYDLPFVTADGMKQNFGVMVSGGMIKPVYWIGDFRCDNVLESTFDNAKSYAFYFLRRGTNDQRILSTQNAITAQTTAIIKSFTKEPLPIPFESNYIFMSDDMPNADWQHPCRYLFLDYDLKRFGVAYASEPIVIKCGGKNIVMAELVGEDLSHLTRKSRSGACLMSAESGGKSSFPAIDGGSSGNCFALLVNGGADYEANHYRYWNEVCFIYNVLVKRFSVPRKNITVLWANGDPETDLCSNASCADCSKFTYETSSIRDFDQDGIDDINGAASRTNLKTVLQHYTDTLKGTDQLLIFFSDHGYYYGNATTNALIWLWNETLKDTELAAFTKDIKCPVMYAVKTCYSGGCVDEVVLSAKNRVIATADKDDPSYAGWLMGDWTYYFFSALCGYYPAGVGTNPQYSYSECLYPRQCGNICNADIDGDGKVSFYEAHLFACKMNPWTAANGRSGEAIDDPQYGESTANLGKKMFMTQYADAPTVIVKEKVLTPTLSPASASLGYAPCTVTASCGTSGATIRYTLDGTEPSGKSTVYAGGITLAGDATVSIRAFKSGMEASDTTRISYAVRKEAPEKALITAVTQGDSSSGIVVYWSGGAGTSYYAIRRSESASMANAVTIASNLSADTCSYLDDTAAVGRDYYYQVVAFNNYGSTVSAVSQAGSRTLAAPASVNVSWVSNEKKFHVSWSAVAGASHYRLYRAIDDSSPVAISAWQTSLSLKDVPDVAAGSRITYYVAAAVSSSGQGMTALVSSSVQTMPDIRDWQLIIDRNATQKCQLIPGGFKQFDCSLKYSDGTFEKENFTTGVRWEVVQVGSHVSHNDSDGSYTGASGIGGIYTAPSTILRVESGDYEESIVLRATYTRNGETRSCEHPIIVTNRRIVSGVYVGVTENYLAPGDEMSVACRLRYLNNDATGAEDIGEETYAIIAGGGAALADDGTLSAFPTDTKTNVTIQVTYGNADGFFTATKSIDIAPQVITTLEFEIPALGGYSPTNEIGTVGYRKPGLNGLSWSLVWNTESWVSRLFYQVIAGSRTNQVNIGRGSGSYTTPDGSAQFAFYADRNDGPSRTEILPFRWNGGGLDVVIRQESAAQVDRPVLLVNVGSLNANCSTHEAVMRYATDGEEPSENSPVMSESLSFDENTECAVKAFADWMIASDTVYADVVGKDSQWDEVEISFVPVQAGLAAPAKRMYAVNETFGELPSFPKTNGLYFKGWSLHEGSEKLVAATDYVPSRDATLYAVWSPVAADKPSWVALPWNFKSTMTAIMKVYDDATGSYLDPSVCIIGIEDTDGVCRGSSENGFGDTQSELNGQNGLYVFGIYSQIESGQETGLKIRIWNRQKGFMSVADASVLFTAGGTLGEEANPFVIHVTMNVCEISIAKTGWHLVSFSALPADPSPANVFGDELAKVGSLADMGSLLWTPTYATLTELSVGEPYWINTTAPNLNLSVVGASDPGREFRVKKGYNRIGYTLANSGNTADVLKTAFESGAITYVADDGSLFYPGGGLETMSPGKVYWVYAPANGTIRYDVE